jgi:hypothetical protein
MAVQDSRRPVSLPEPKSRLADVDVLELEAWKKLSHRRILCEKIVRVCA